jgi:predicted membrane channel-forming protein YqfA (hemolysin III family)
MSSVPDGYRTGFITALAVFLGFSLAFLRFWTLEAPGEWSPKSVAAASILGVSILFQLISLFRALNVRDDQEIHYRVTVRWFLAGVVVLILGVGVSIASSAAG